MAISVREVRHKKLNLVFQQWTDGVQQWAKMGQPGKTYYAVERHRTAARTTRWCIVDRSDERYNETVRAPKVAGPFPDVKAAFTAYLLLTGGSA